MKKRLCVLLALVLMLCLCACGETDPNLGVYTCTNIRTQGMDLTPDEIFPGGVVLELKSGGRGTMTVDGEPGNIKWSLDGSEFSLETADGISAGELNNGVITLELVDTGIVLTLRGENAPNLQLLQELPTETETAPEVPDWWNGDWYGWWQIENSTGDLPNEWYDAFAQIEVLSDGSVYITLWDEDFSRDDPMGEGAFLHEEGETELGRLVSEAGYFFYDELEPEEWIIEPDEYIYSDFIGIEGHHDAEGESFDYVIFLRPWGTVWDDVEEENLPYFYENWYLPLIEAGEPMPDAIPQEVLDEAYGGGNPQG